MAVWSCWILWGNGTRCCVCRSRASPTCSMSDTYGACWPCKNWDVFSFQQLCGPARSWRGGMNGTTMGLRISLWYLCTFKMPSIKCTYVRCPYHNPTATMSINKRLSYTTPCMLPSICPVQWNHSSMKKIHLQSARSYSGWLWWQSLVGSRARWGQRAWPASMRGFLTVCVEILQLCKPIVAGSSPWSLYGNAAINTFRRPLQ